MIRVRPFRAWRPAAWTAHLVGSRSFLTYSPEQLRDKLAGNPYSFLQVVHAGHEQAEGGRAGHYDKVRLKFREFIGEGILEREARPSFYLYEQSCTAFTTLGLIGVVSVNDYEEGRIKVHEHTLQAREERFTEYLEHTGINAEPVLLAVPEGRALEARLLRLCQGTALFDFATTDRVRHRIWRVDAPEEIEGLCGEFLRMASLYIADGHHRSASSARLARDHQADGNDPRSWCLAYMVPATQLHIFNFDRAVKGMNGLTPAGFIEALGQVGPVTALPRGPEAQVPMGHVHVRSHAGWHLLRLPAVTGGPACDALDASVLSRSVLAPVLGITDLRSDPRVRFVPGIQGVSELDRLVDQGIADVAFNLCALPFRDLAAVADQQGLMPPKTTWVEPKLRSGLTIYSLEDH